MLACAYGENHEKNAHKPAGCGAVCVGAVLLLRMPSAASAGLKRAAGTTTKGGYQMELQSALEGIGPGTRRSLRIGRKCCAVSVMGMTFTPGTIPLLT